MAMPTEEKRVVKKVVVQPDGTKKVIKKIIRKVPKKEGIAAVTSETEVGSNKNGENLQTSNKSSVSLEAVSDLFDNQENNQNSSTENIVQPENPLNDNLVQNGQADQATNQTENQGTENLNKIDLGNFDFNQEPKQEEQPAQVQQETIPTEDNSGADSLDMSSLLGAPVEDGKPQVVQTGTENQATSENTASLNLDQMINQPQQDASVNQSQNSEEAFDPFMAMKTALESSDMASNTLDLDSMTMQSETQQEQPVEQSLQTAEQSINQPVAQQPEVAVSDTPTLDLNAMPSQMGTAPVQTTTPAAVNPIAAPTQTNPMTNGVMQNLGGIAADPKKKNLITIVASCFGVLVLFAIVLIRYPDMFAGGGEEHGSYEPTPETNNWNQGSTQTQIQTTDSTPTTEQNNENTNINDENTNTNISGNTGTAEIQNQGTQEEEIVIKQRDPVTITDEDFFTDEDIPTVLLDEVSIGGTTSGDTVNPLQEIEGLIGPVSGNDTIVKEATEYAQKGKELKDKGASQNNRNIMKFGTFIEGKANEILAALENGENIDISTWISQKEQFDEYLKKANES